MSIWCKIGVHNWLAVTSPEETGTHRVLKYLAKDGLYYCDRPEDSKIYHNKICRNCEKMDFAYDIMAKKLYDDVKRDEELKGRFEKLAKLKQND
jgi:hypothetical protein